MSTVFIVLVVLMCLLAIAIMIWPLWFVRSEGSVDYKESNLGLYQHKLGELETDLAEGRIDQEGYDKAREELDRQLLTDIPDEAAEDAGPVSKRQPAIAALVVLIIPVVSFLMYQQLGTLDADEQIAQHQQAQQEPDMEQMIRGLENRLITEGGDVTAWTMLGRGYKHLRRFDEAVGAYDKALQQAVSPDAGLLLETAEAIALANGQRFDERARQFALRAVALEPDNINALWFAGVAEFQFAEYWQSVDHLARLAEIAPRDDVLINSVQHYLGQSRDVLLSKGEDVAPIDEVLQLIAKSSPQTKPVAAGDVRRIMASIEVSDEIRAGFDATTTVFVYARASQGPRMPLAIQRLSVGDLPAVVGLDDSMAMVEGMNLSAFDEVEVLARISPTGQAVPNSGDAVTGAPVTVSGNEQRVSLVIDRLVP